MTVTQLAPTDIVLTRVLGMTPLRTYPDPAAPASPCMSLAWMAPDTLPNFTSPCGRICR